MKNPIKQLKNYILRFFRRKQFKKRQAVYDAAIDGLADAVAKIEQDKFNAALQKIKDQEALSAEITTYMRDKLHYDSKSEYIPGTRLNDAELKTKIHIKFKFRMDKLGLFLTNDLQLKCTS